MYYLSLFDKIIIKIHTCTPMYTETCKYVCIYMSIAVFCCLAFSNLSKSKNYYLAKFIANVNLIYTVNILGLNIKNLMRSLILEFSKYCFQYFLSRDQDFSSLILEFRLYVHIRILLYWNSTV